MPVRLLSLFILLAGLSAAVAQPSGTRLRGESESGRTRKRLTEAQQKLADGKPVADELQDILDQSGDDLVLVKDNQYQPARRLVQQYLTGLPEKELNTFRDRIEEPAKKLLEAGKRKRDPRPLRELVERYFVSRPAEEGLLLLGELMFERGDFVAAERAWRMLLPSDDGGPTYPKPKTDPAGVKALVILARAMGGDGTGAAADLEQFKKDHPTASGALGGMSGVYADALAKLVAAPPVPPAATAGWSGFAGGPARDGRPDSPLPRFLAGERPWRAAIPHEPRDKDRSPASLAPAKAHAFHPVILNGFAYIADAGRVIRFDLKTETARVVYHAVNLEIDFDPSDFALPYPHEADFTLTAADGRLFARFGKTALPTGNDTSKFRTLIACLELKPDAATLPPTEYPLQAKWAVTPPAAKDTPAAWQGAPVVADGRVYAGFVRAEGNRLVHAVACYPVAGGEPHWVADVFDTDPRVAATHRHEVLTLAGGNVVCCSHAGVTVAVSAVTGKPAWAFRNPPAERQLVVPARDLCPAVYHDGRVFIAPADGDAVYALDADTGRRLWQSAAPIHVEQLLGVSQGRLVVTTHVARTGSQVARQGGIRGYDVATGIDRQPLGWQNHDDGGLNSYGRGVAGANLILWPTAGKVWVLDPATGRQPRFTNAKLSGNVAVADGYIVCATATEVLWYQFDGDSMGPPPPRMYPIMASKDVPAFDPKAKVATAEKVDFGLPAPAEERKAVALPAFARPLIPITPPQDAPLVVCDGKTLFAHDADSGKELWHANLGTPAAFTRVAFTTDGKVLAWGESAVAAADAKSGKLAWEYRVPPADPTPRLSAFTFVGNRLVAKLGDRGLIALDLSTGKLVWTRAANDTPAVEAFGIDTAPKFGPHIATVGDRVFVQRDDECWVLDATTGERRDSFLTTVQEWAAPPVAVGGKVIVPVADGTLAAVSSGGSERFHDPGRETSRTGTPPALRVFGDAVLVVTPRNIGDELFRPQTRATTPARQLLPPWVDLEHADADGERIYLPADRKVFAVNRETLKEAWHSTLPDLTEGVRWQVRAGRTTLVVYPTVAVRADPWDGTSEARSVAYHPTPLRLLGSAGELLEASTRFTLPVLILDPATGKLRQQIDVPVSGPAVAVVPRPGGLLVAGTGRAMWLEKK